MLFRTCDASSAQRSTTAEGLVSRPRRVVKGEVLMGTRRCIQRRFLLRPDGITTMVFKYLLARAARLTGVLIHEFKVLSNHYHIVFSDPRGQRSKFFQELNSLLARAVNAAFGEWETMFAPGSFNAVVLVDGDTIEQKCLYTLCNAVKDGLVSHPARWEGASSWGMEYGKREYISRPKIAFFKTMRPTEVLVLVRPEALYPELSDAEARARLREKATERSHAYMKKLRKKGGAVMGMARVRKQPRDSSPLTRAPRRGIRPTVAGANKWARIEALQRNAEFLADHEAARLEFEKGNHDVRFPIGTYLMVQRYGVAVVSN